MKPVVLTIMDGVGIGAPGKGNAYDLAKKPNIDKIFSKYPTTLLNASGEYVGLPDGQMGNSEVGHLNIGAGRVVYQMLELINKGFRENTIKDNDTYKELVKFAKANNNVVHVMGLLSDGGVHSHINHFIGVIELLNSEGINVKTHTFFDGRDVGPKTALNYISQIEEVTNKLGNGHICSGSGRYYSMDRDTNYDRTKLAYDAIVHGKAKNYSSSTEAINDSYDNDVVDEFIYPYVISGYEGVNDNDAFIFINFRPDRAIQISNAIINSEFSEFETVKFNNLYFASLTKYTRVDSKVLFNADKISNGLGEYLSKINKKQLRIAETEKYAHVTFFFDGGVEKDYEGLKKVLVDSPKVATYDLQPEMSAYEVCDNVLIELDKDYDVIILNFANPDMVGHTGKIDATIKAVEAVDHCIGKIYEKVMDLNGVMIITADHGNSEKLLDEQGSIVTSHTTNQVPFCITKPNIVLNDNMSLCDISPTILKLLGEKIPEEMTGKSIYMEENNE